MKKLLLKHKKTILFLVLFALYFAMLSVFKNQIQFTDEADNMLGGMTIARGGEVYNHFPSQHLPLMYYLMSIFSFLGFKGTYILRLCFYGLLSLIWTLMVKRYSKCFKSNLMVLYPILYIFLMANVSYGYTVVAEHIQAQCLVILFLEFYFFNKKKEISTISQIIIGICLYGAIWSAFVSVIPIFVLGISMLIVDMKEFYSNNKKINFSKYIKHLISKYYVLLLATIVPFLGSILLIIAEGNIESFFKQAFYLNMEVYSKYNNYNSNVIITILKTFFDYFNYNLGLVRTFSKAFLLYLFFNVFFIINNYKKNFLITILMFSYIILAGNRGFENTFHSIPFFALSIISCLISLNFVDFSMFKLPFFNMKIVKSFLLVMALLISGFTYLSSLKNIISPILKTNNFDIELALSDEYIYFFDVFTYKYVDSGLLPASRFNSLVPWFAELYEDDVIVDLKKTQPNIIYYVPYGDVWGRVYSNFAPKIDYYIKTNYIYDSVNNFWVKKSYKEHAERILKRKIADYTTLYNKEILLNPLMDNSIIEQTFTPLSEKISNVGLKFQTYDRINYSLVRFSIYNNSTKIKEIIFSASNLKNNEMYNFDLSDIIFDVSSEYRFQIQAYNTSYFDNISIYCTMDNNNFDNNHTIINGINTNYDLSLNFYYN